MTLSGKLAAIVVLLSQALFIGEANQAVQQTLPDSLRLELEKKTAELISAHPGLRGTLVVSITIEKGGWVSAAAIVQRDVDDTEPLISVMESIYKWRFAPAGERVFPVTLKHTFRFGSQTDSTKLFLTVMAAVVAAIATLIIIVRFA
jgi:hypothetical protein